MQHMNKNEFQLTLRGPFFIPICWYHGKFLDFPQLE